MTERPGLSDWLAEREPRAPDAVELDPREPTATGDGEADDPLAALLVQARVALRDALEGRGERRGAFRLLASDAYVTYACEAALEAEDPRAALLAVVRGLVSELEDG